jgi:coenzyme F420 hydrogenase subunit beta
MENSVLHRERRPDESFGVFRRAVAAQATDKEILAKAQDGGLVTALLLSALGRGVIDGAIVSGTMETKPLFPIPRLATTAREILESAGTRYFYSTNILALPEAAGKMKALAFGGTPCQIRAIRKMQVAGLKKNVAAIKLLVGLICSECFTYEGLTMEIQEKLGIKPAEINKMNIKGRMLITSEQETKTMSLVDAKKHVRTGCRACEDFSSEFADISAGGLGMDRWTLTIIRTRMGEELFLEASKAGLIKVTRLNEWTSSLLCKLSAKKARRLSE